MATGFEHGTLAGAATGNALDQRYVEAIDNPAAFALHADYARSGSYGCRMTGPGGATLTRMYWSSGILLVSDKRVYRMWGRHQSGSAVFFASDDAGSIKSTFRYNAADSTIRANAFDNAGVSIATEVVSTVTVATGAWFRLDVYVDQSANPWIVKWRVNGTDQADLSVPTPAANCDFAIIGTPTNTTFNGALTFDYDDIAISIDAADWPLADGRIVGLKADPSGTLTVSGSASNFGTFSSNGTVSAWNATTARDAIGELPPTIGASADGLVQTAAAAFDYVQIPMETYPLAESEYVHGARMLACGWAASSTAATIGFYSWNGTTQTLINSTGDPNFDNSTTSPAWVCEILAPGDIATQAQLSALALRVGFSDDATPDIGIHAVYVELAVGDAGLRRVLGLEDDTFTVDYAFNPATSAPISYVITTPAGTRGASFTYTRSGTPAVITVGPGASHVERIDGAVDVSSVSDIELLPDPA